MKVELAVLVNGRMVGRARVKDIRNIFHGRNEAVRLAVRYLLDEALKKGTCSNRTAAKRLGITVRTFYRWRNAAYRDSRTNRGAPTRPRAGVGSLREKKTRY